MIKVETLRNERSLILVGNSFYLINFSSFCTDDIEYSLPSYSTTKSEDPSRMLSNLESCELMFWE